MASFLAGFTLSSAAVSIDANPHVISTQAEGQDWLEKTVLSLKGHACTDTHLASSFWNNLLHKMVIFTNGDNGEYSFQIPLEMQSHSLEADPMQDQPRHFQIIFPWFKSPNHSLSLLDRMSIGPKSCLYCGGLLSRPALLVSRSFWNAWEF